jgi:WD40 repeat protein
MPRMPQPLRGAPTVEEAVGELLGIEGELGAPVTAVLLAGERFVVTTGDGRVAFSDESFQTAEVVQPHSGVILSAAATEKAVIVGTDDGRAVLVAPGEGVTVLWRDARGQWVDHVATGRNSTMAWSSGKSIHVRRSGHPDCILVHPSSVGGLAFAPKSDKLAVSHYGGVSVWDFGIDPPAKRMLEWKGMHLDLSWSLDERFIVTAMQEGAVHGWRLSDPADFQMSGYPSKPRSLSWSRRGDWLATSGATEILLWTFKGKKGPMGTSPLVLSRRPSQVAQVAFHPLNSYVAAGYRDGAILLARQYDMKELLVRRAKGGSVTGLAWSRDGRRLAYGTDNGAAGLVDFSLLEEREVREKKR